MLAEVARQTANVLVFPNLVAGNIGYKLPQSLGGAVAIGPMLVGMDKPVHVLQRGDELKDIVNLAVVGGGRRTARINLFIVFITIVKIFVQDNISRTCNLGAKLFLR